LIAIGPKAGNVSFRIDVHVTEKNSDGGSPPSTAFLMVDLKNQEIIWNSAAEDFRRNCKLVEGLFAGPAVVIGPRLSQDPADLVTRVTQNIEQVQESVSVEGEGRAEGLRGIANLMEGSRPELAAALKSLADQK
jgi:hypothetical protein